MPAVSTPAAPPERRRRRIPWGAIALVGVLLVFALGVARLFELRFDVGDIYPPYSTLRSDPLGAKVFYASIEAVPGLRVERSLRPLAALGTEPLQPADHDNGERAFTCFYLGADPAEWPYLFDPADAERLETIMRRGGRVVITFQPTQQAPTAEALARMRTTHDASDSEGLHKNQAARERAKKARMPDLIARWGIDFRRPPARSSHKHTDDTHDIPVPNASPAAADPTEFATPDAALAGRSGPDAAFAVDREAVPWHSVLDFGADAIHARLVRWSRLYERRGHPVIVSRPFGTAGGELILAGDTYFLSNEGIRDDPGPAVLAALVGGGRHLFFDESHLGLLEKPGLVTLARRYRLQGALAAVGLLVALFVWRNVVSLVPAHAVSSPGTTDEPDAVPGRPAASGYLNLLRRSVRPRDLPGLCVAQWEQGATGGRQPIAAGVLERVRAVLAQETALPARKRSPVAAVYQAICAAAGQNAKCKMQNAKVQQAVGKVSN